MPDRRRGEYRTLIILEGLALLIAVLYALENIWALSAQDDGSGKSPPLLWFSVIALIWRLGIFISLWSRHRTARSLIVIDSISPFLFVSVGGFLSSAGSSFLLALSLGSAFSWFAWPISIITLVLVLLVPFRARSESGTPIAGTK